MKQMGKQGEFWAAGQSKLLEQGALGGAEANGEGRDQGQILSGPYHHVPGTGSAPLQAGSCFLSRISPLAPGPVLPHSDTWDWRTVGPARAERPPLPLAARMESDFESCPRPRSPCLWQRGLIKFGTRTGHCC